jgi:S-adenosylmethionine:tRNA ribosyltransferase-isomerase
MAERRWTTADFDYDLPDALIAQAPTGERGESRLLVLERGGSPPGRLADRTFPALLDLVPPGDLMVLNTTKVRHARLLASRPSGGPAEVLLLHPAGDDTWLAMGKPGRALLPGKRVHLDDTAAIEVVSVDEEGFRRVRFVGCDAETAIARFGRLPLPPYITRDPVELDEHRYQTVYADREGSVAAPTAGLHFTGGLIDAMRANGVEFAEIDLEVGPGTFRPVETADPGRHPMHAERFEIGARAASQVAAARQRGAAVWAVGTTVVRALESAARDDRTVAAGGGDTRLLILPGFRFRVVDHLVTNFHLPRSTLLMLVGAFAGVERTLDAYRHAVEQRYRFYSYGDAMCIL